MGIRPPVRVKPLIPDAPEPPSESEVLFVLPAMEAKNNRFLKPLWRDLILKTWGQDPMRCPCCQKIMRNAGTMVKREEIEFFLRLHGMWEGIISLPPPPDPPDDVERLEPFDVPPNRGWSDNMGPPPDDWWVDTERSWEAPELALDEGRTLVLDADPLPPEDTPVFSLN